MGNLKKKDGQKIKGDEKTGQFKKWGRSKLKKWETAWWERKNTDLFLKKRWGANRHKVKIANFLKMGVN